jgi:hypothetical protein
MQRVKMLRDVPGSFDGIAQMMFRAGREYDLPDNMVRDFINEGWVELVLETKPEPVTLETGKRRKRK